MKVEANVILRQQVQDKWRTQRMKKAKLSFSRDITKEKIKFVNLVIDGVKKTLIPVSRNVHAIYDKYLQSEGKASVRFKDPVIECFLEVGAKTPSSKLGLYRIIMLLKQISEGNDNKISMSEDDPSIAGAKKSLMPDMNMLPKKLANVTTLNLSDRGLTKLPAYLGNMHLVELNLNNNKLGNGPRTWPWVHGPISQTLTYLTINNNNLSRVPPELHNCRRLVHLSLKNNNLQSLPATLLNPYKNMKSLCLDDNVNLSSIPYVKMCRLTDISVVNCHKIHEPCEMTSTLFQRSLFYLAANAALGSKIKYNGQIPQELVQLLDLHHFCSKCLTPMLQGTYMFKMRSMTDLAWSARGSHQDIKCYEAVCNLCSKISTLLRR